MRTSIERKPTGIRGRAAGAVAALVIALLWTSAAYGWWNDRWEHRRRITFDTSPAGADIKENVTDVPVLVRLHPGNFNFANAKEDGSDIRFVFGDDKTPLKHHVEKFDPIDGIALLWVKVPQLAAAAKTDFVWLYYGNKDAVPDQDPGGTYDTAQVLAYHLGETEGPPRDATAFANNAAEFSGAQGLPAAVGAGIALNGAGDRIRVPRSPSLALPGGFTFAAWVRITEPQREGLLFSREEEGRALTVSIEQTGVAVRIAADKGKPFTLDAANVLTPQTWQHVAVAYDPGKRLAIFVDGVERAASDRPPSMPQLAADVFIGASGKGDRSFAGELDEVEIASAARAPGWIRAVYAGQAPETKLTIYGDEEASGGGGSLTIQYLRVVARAISLDGWVIIGFLGLLGALGWIVFFNKALMVRQSQNGNLAFSRAFTGLKDPTALEEEEGLEASPMYRVYLAGREELKGWVGNPHPAVGEGLSQRAMNSVKASLDRAFLKESQRLGDWLVVLTMSITGGPFLGLLGTVWGVMNTFAGMAEAGEANLLAIAPGVASALSATLAGLLVAIPALFAYNYLTSQIKKMNADMTLFVEEFTLRVEGFYGG